LIPLRPGDYQSIHFPGADGPQGFFSLFQTGAQFLNIQRSCCFVLDLSMGTSGVEFDDFLT